MVYSVVEVSEENGVFTRMMRHFSSEVSQKCEEKHGLEAGLKNRGGKLREGGGVLLFSKKLPGSHQG